MTELQGLDRLVHYAVRGGGDDGAVHARAKELGYVYAPQDLRAVPTPDLVRILDALATAYDRIEAVLKERAVSAPDQKEGLAPFLELVASLPTLPVQRLLAQREDVCDVLAAIEREIKTRPLPEASQ